MITPTTPVTSLRTTAAWFDVDDVTTTFGKVRLENGRILTLALYDRFVWQCLDYDGTLVRSGSSYRLDVANAEAVAAAYGCPTR